MAGKRRAFGVGRAGPLATALCALAIGLSACANEPIGKLPAQVEMPPPEEVVARSDDPSVLYLPVGHALTSRPMRNSERIADPTVIGPVSLPGVPASEAIEAVLEGSGIGMTWQTSDFADPSIQIVGMKGTRQQIIDRVCSMAGIYCSIRDGVLEIKKNETFVVDLPPIPKDTEDSIAKAIEKLSGNDVTRDPSGGSLIYTANADGYERVSRYLDDLKSGRPLVVMQFYLWDVVLNESNELGVKWDRFALNNLGSGKSPLDIVSTAAAPAITGGIGIGAVLSGGTISADIMANFLSKHGVLESISQPTLTFVSGNSGEFKDGKVVHYVKRVGQIVANNGTSTGTNPNNGTLGTNTVDTEELELGLNIDITGQFENGTIFGSLKISRKELLELTPVQVGELTMQLPQTTDREVKTVLRMRPGDTLVLGGIRSSRMERSRQGLPVGTGSLAPTYGSDAKERVELVIMAKSKVMFFKAGPSDPVLPGNAGQLPPPPLASIRQPLANGLIGGKPESVPPPLPLTSNSTEGR
jgi:hypothetical protein